MEVIIRTETSDDYKVVFDLNVKAFGQENESRLIEALRKSNAFVPELSLVAEVDGKVVGHILFTKVTIGDSKHEGLALAPVAVAPDAQRQGLGTRLVEAGLKKAAELGFDSVVVLGHENYYPKFGFKSASNWNITTGYNSPESTFALELKNGALEHVSGLVEYPKEFLVVS